MPAKNRDDKGKPQSTPDDKPDAHPAEVAFDQIMDAILGANPKAVRDQRNRRHKRERKIKR